VDDARARIHYSVMLAEAGRTEEALHEGAQAQEASPGDPVMLYNVTCLYARLGEPRRAIDALHQAIDAGYVNFAWIKQDPDINSLRDDAEFQALIAGR